MTRMIITPPTDDGKDPQDVRLSAMDEKVVQETVEELDRYEKKALEAWDSRSEGTNVRGWLTLSILLFANLLNYMDRYTLAGVLDDVKKYYGLADANTGLLQTSFIVSYMLFSPLFGFLGDRVNRKLIMALGILFWSTVTLAGSFVPAHLYPVFLLLRALVGIGEASYSTIAPTIIADLFVKDKRTTALAIFYFAIPVGSGLGYIVGSYVAKIMGSWQYALRVTPCLGVICVLLILIVLREVPRGEAEGGTHLTSTSWVDDLKALCKIKSFLFCTGGFTCVAFVAGALALWGPLFIEYSIVVQHPDISLKDIDASVSMKFGIITCIAGTLGVAIGSESGRRLRKIKRSADPLVCAFGLMGSAPFFFLAIYLSRYNTMVTFIFIFIAETLLSLNWALVTDMLLYVVIPTRRSTAEAGQILFSHAFGDAGSPYLIGLISDQLRRRNGNTGTMIEKYTSLQNSLYISCFVCVLGGVFFLCTSIFINEDRSIAEKTIKGRLGFNKGDDSETGSSLINPIDGSSSSSGISGDDDITCNNEIEINSREAILA